MAACTSCGANASGVACEFCGAIQLPPETLEQEMEALQALSKAAQHIATTAGSSAENAKGGILAANQAVVLAERATAQRLAAFWKSAWLPSQVDSLIQASQMAMAGIVFPDGLQSTVSIAKTELAQTLMRRAGTALDAAELGDPADARIGVLRRKYEGLKSEEKEARAAQEAELGKMHKQLFVMLGVFLAVFGLALLLIKSGVLE